METTYAVQVEVATATERFWRTIQAYTSKAHADDYASILLGARVVEVTA